MKVFLVDDSPEMLDLLGVALREAGFEVTAAHDGAEALFKIPIEQPDIVVLDVMMPAVDGIQVTRGLRATARTARIPIILLSAKDDVEIKVAGLEAGADEYVVKPVRPSELIARIRALLRRSKMYAEAAPPASRVIGFLGVKGGVGTTSLAVNTAIALAEAGKSVILVDLHPWTGAVALQMGLPLRAGVAPVADKGPGGITKRSLEGSIVRHKSGVGVLTLSHSSVEAGSKLTPDLVAAVLDQLESMSEVTIVDMGSGVTPTAVESMSHCHLTILVAEADTVALSLAKDTLRRLEATGSAGSRLEWVVVNRSRSASTYTREEMEDLLGAKLLAVITPAPEVFFHATKASTPVLLSMPDTASAVQLRELSRKLV